MIDIARDYLAITVGAAQLGAARAYAVGRSTLGHVVAIPSQALRRSQDRAFDLRGPTVRSRDLIAALLQAEIERMVSMIGLVPESELVVVRQQVERLERQLAEARSGAARTAPRTVPRTERSPG